MIYSSLHINEFQLLGEKILVLALRSVYYAKLHYAHYYLLNENKLLSILFIFLP